MPTQPPVRRVCLFAHFDAQNEVKRYILHYLAQLRPHCERIVFVSTSALPEAELAKARAHCDDAFTRENVGADFMMWKDGLSRVDLGAYDELLLANSSVFGPLAPLQGLFDRMAGRDLDVWGVSDNLHQAWHLQSYFIVFKRHVFTSEAFARFWASVLPYREKHQVILSYEIGLSRWLAQNGFRLGAVVPFESLDQKARVRDGLRVLLYKVLLGQHAFNPMSTYPEQVIERGAPFVKLETLRDNPMGVVLDRTMEVVAASGYDMSMIEFDRPANRAGRQFLTGKPVDPKSGRWLNRVLSLQRTESGY